MPLSSIFLLFRPTCRSRRRHKKHYVTRAAADTRVRC